MTGMRRTVVGIDIGGTNTRLALVDAAGEILARERFVTAIEQGREAFVARLCKAIDTLRETAASRGDELAAVAAGAPGLVGADGVIHSSVNLRPLEGVNLQAVLAGHSGLPAAVLNDANASAFGERRFGAGRRFGSFLLLTLGTGVGSGLVLDGRLWSGYGGFAAEFGHVTVEPDGLPCPCGNHGCLEQYASATALVAAAFKVQPREHASALAGLSRDELAAEKIGLLAAAGDRLALYLFERVGRYIGIAAAGAANFLNIEALIIGGGMAASFDLLVPAIRRELQTRAFPQISSAVNVVRGELGDDAGMLGSAAVAWETLG